MSDIKVGHSYIYREDGTLDDQVILTWPVSNGGTQDVYNPNLTARDLTLLRHLVWVFYDIYKKRGTLSYEDILRMVIHPLMFRNIKWEEIFTDFSEKKP